MNTMFSTLLAATAAKVEVPVDGSTGVWVKSDTAVVVSGMAVTYTSTIGSGREANVGDVYLRGVFSGAVVGYWGNLRVRSGGTAIDMRVAQNGANANVSTGGLAMNAAVQGGRLYIAGTAAGAVVSGGSMIVNAGGSASCVVLSGGSLIVRSGGTALAVTSSAGAVVTVLDGGYIEYA